MCSKRCLIALFLIATFCVAGSHGWYWFFRRFRIRIPHPRTTMHPTTYHTTTTTGHPTTTTTEPTTTTTEPTTTTTEPTTTTTEPTTTTTEPTTTTTEPTTTTIPAPAINCGESLALSGGATVNISSPNYPNDFALTDNCLWNITVPDGYLIQLVIEDLELPSCHHKLEVQEGATFPGISECGRIFGIQNVITHDNSLQVKFQANSNSSPEKGFLITVRAVSTACDVNLCQNGGTCLTTNNNKTFDCSCPLNYTGNLCETFQEPDCPRFPEYQTFTQECCYDIPDLSSCEVLRSCTFLSSGCTYDCAAFENDMPACVAIPTCAAVSLLGFMICAFLGPNGEIILPDGYNATSILVSN